MLRIRTYNKISAKGLAKFSKSAYEVGEDLDRPDALILRSKDLHAEPLPESVLAIARAGAGVNNIPVPACTQNGQVVFNTPGANANAVKELVLAGLLLSCRDIAAGMAKVKELAATPGVDIAAAVEKEKKAFAGIELAGRTLGVIGLGAIGSAVAEAALALDMQVVGFDPALSVDAAWRLPNRVEKVDDLNALAARADFLTAHVPAIDATRGMIGAALLASIKPGAVVLNFARGTIVDDEAMLAALDAGRVRKYVTDFPNQAVVGRDDVLAVPHLGASTQEAEDNCAVMAAVQLIDFLEHGNITNSVNFPSANLERHTGRRLTITNSNAPGVLGKVLDVLSKKGANVAGMVNRSRGDIAYNILDVADLTDDMLDDLRAVEHVIAVRTPGS